MNILNNYDIHIIISTCAHVILLNIDTFLWARQYSYELHTYNLVEYYFNQYILNIRRPKDFIQPLFEFTDSKIVRIFMCIISYTI